MANAYIAGKWSGTLSANLKGDASKTTPTLGDDFDSELNNLKKARTNVKNTINAINKEIKLLKNHAETGKMATMYLKSENHPLSFHTKRRKEKGRGGTGRREKRNKEEKKRISQ